MTGKLIIDELERPNGAKLMLPMALGTGGVLEADAAGQMTVVPKPAPVLPSAVSKVFDFSVGGVGVVDMLWDDLETGLVLDDIAHVLIRGVGISSSSGFFLYFKALSAPAAPVDTGQMGFTRSGKYGSSTSRSDTVGSNSNLGYMQFPTYQHATETTNTNGPGNITFDALLHPHAGSHSKGVAMHFNGSYRQSSYNSPNTETVAWGCYSNTVGLPDFTAGIRMYPTVGALDHGSLEVTAILKRGA